MTPSVKLGSLFGVQIGLHYTWFLVAGLICFVLAGRFAASNPDWGTTIIWSTAILTAVAFFITLLLHELSHALVAKAFKLPVKSIVLFALGGVAQIEKESATAKAEFWMGIVGPIVSAVIGFVCLVLASAFEPSINALSGAPLPAALLWLGYINIALAVFNMLPGFPLDGGRVLKAIVWWVTKDEARGTVVAATTGSVFSLVLIGAGAFLAIFHSLFSGLWLALIGWFLGTAAQGTLMQNQVKSSLSGIRSNDVMLRDFAKISSSATIQEFIEQCLRSGERTALVFASEDSQDLVGLVSIADVKSIERGERATRLVREVMHPLTEIETATVDTPVSETLELMTRKDVNQIPVIANGKVVGVVTRAKLLEIVETISDLRLRSA
jgi:Zn-dependent protease/CBS domain-containing protein